MLRQLAVFGLAAVLTGGMTAAFADDRGRGFRDGHGGKHHFEKRGGDWGRHYRGKHYRDKDFRGRHYRGKHYGHSHHKYYRGRWAPRYRGSYYYYDASRYLGSALVGAAVSYALFHNHNGAVCYDSHSRGYGSTNYEVTGCHRIETLPDGSQRRVEVPMSACY